MIFDILFLEVFKTQCVFFHSQHTFQVLKSHTWPGATMGIGQWRAELSPVSIRLPTLCSSQHSRYICISWKQKEYQNWLGKSPCYNGVSQLSFHLHGGVTILRDISLHPDWSNETQPRQSPVWSITKLPLSSLPNRRGFSPQLPTTFPLAWTSP